MPKDNNLHKKNNLRLLSIIIAILTTTTAIFAISLKLYPYSSRLLQTRGEEMDNQTGQNPPEDETLIATPPNIPRFKGEVLSPQEVTKYTDQDSVIIIDHPVRLTADFFIGMTFKLVDKGQLVGVEGKTDITVRLGQPAIIASNMDNPLISKIRIYTDEKIYYDRGGPLDIDPPPKKPSENVILYDHVRMGRIENIHLDMFQRQEVDFPKMVGVKLADCISCSVTESILSSALPNSDTVLIDKGRGTLIWNNEIYGFDNSHWHYKLPDSSLSRAVVLNETHSTLLATNTINTGDINIFAMTKTGEKNYLFQNRLYSVLKKGIQLSAVSNTIGLPGTIYLAENRLNTYEKGNPLGIISDGVQVIAWKGSIDRIERFSQENAWRVPEALFTQINDASQIEIPPDLSRKNILNLLIYSPMFTVNPSSFGVPATEEDKFFLSALNIINYGKEPPPIIRDGKPHLLPQYPYVLMGVNLGASYLGGESAKKIYGVGDIYSSNDLTGLTQEFNTKLVRLSISKLTLEEIENEWKNRIQPLVSQAKSLDIETMVLIELPFLPSHDAWKKFIQTYIVDAQADLVPNSIQFGNELGSWPDEKGVGTHYYVGTDEDIHTVFLDYVKELNDGVEKGRLQGKPIRLVLPSLTGRYFVNEENLIKFFNRIVDLGIDVSKVDIDIHDGFTLPVYGKSLVYYRDFFRKNASKIKFDTKNIHYVYSETWMGADYTARFIEWYIAQLHEKLGAEKVILHPATAGYWSSGPGSAGSQPPPTSFY